MFFECKVFFNCILILWCHSLQVLSLARKSRQASSGCCRHPPHRRALLPAFGPWCPSVSRGRLSGILLLPGERQPWPACLHQGPGQHPEAPPAWGPSAAHWSPGGELLFRGSWGTDPCGLIGWSPGVFESERKRLHPDPAGGLHTVPGYEGWGWWCDRSVFCKGKEGLIK